MDPDTIVTIIILLILLMLSAFFSSSETALTMANPLHVKSLVTEGRKGALMLDKVLSKKSKMLSTVLIGNNIVNLAASAIATSLAIRLSGGKNAYIGYSTAVLTILVILFGEIIPKTYSMIHYEKYAIFCSYPIRFLMIVLTPLILIVNALSTLFLKLFGIDPHSKGAMITETDLLTYVDEGHAEGILEEEERDMIKNVFDFGDALARDIMIPRIDIAAVEVNVSYTELLKLFRNTMYTRIPVYEDDKENIIGIINVKDFLLIPAKKEFSVRDFLREGYYTYETKKASDLFPEMRQNNAGVAFVLNEYGATVGMITMEDLLEEIVGEIRDEYDDDEVNLIKEEGEGTYLVAASLKLDDLNDSLKTDFTSENYDTVGGLVIELLERIPRNKESVSMENGCTLKVVGVRHNRIQKVRIKLPKQETAEPEE